MSSVPRFRLYASIDDKANVTRPADTDRSLTFLQLYASRLAGCRYAVVGTWSPDMHCDRYYVLDLFATLRDTEKQTFIMPDPLFDHDDLDAAIMGTLMLFGTACNKV